MREGYNVSVRSEWPTADRVLIRPSYAQYRLGLATRRRRATALAVRLAPVIVAYGAAAFAFSRGNINWVLLPIVAVIVLGTILLLADRVYLAVIRVEVTTGRITRTGFPFPRREASLSGLHAIVGRSVDFGYGIVTKGWFVVDRQGFCPCWFFADLWASADMRRVAETFGGTLQETAEAPMARTAVGTVFPGPAKRW